MQLNVQGQRVFITAGAHGIGYTVAQTFIKGGAKVLICDIDEEQLAHCKDNHPELETIRTDVSDSSQVASLFEKVVSRLGGLDVLVNNVGIAGPTALVEDIDPDDWDRTLRINLNSFFYCTRQAVPLIKAAGGGSIVNMSSSAGVLGFPQRSPYAASKWAIIGLTKTWAMELGEFRIRVNAICPYGVEGPRLNRVIAAEAKAKGVSLDEAYRSAAGGSSMKTFITASDVAGMILFLCSEAGNRISGQALGIDGHIETLR